MGSYLREREEKKKKGKEANFDKTRRIYFGVADSEGKKKTVRL